MAITATNSNTTASSPINIVHGTHTELIAFLVLNIWPSHFGIPVLLAVILFGKIHRHPTFLNLCVTFMITGISSSLLLYAGKITGPEPSKTLCLLQASLLYGYPPMTSVAAFALVLQMFLVMQASYYGKKRDGQIHVLWLWLLLSGPYLAFLLAVLATAVIGALHPHTVSRNRRFFYCSVESDPLTNSITIFSAAFLLATLFVEGWLIIALCKRWMAVKTKNFSGNMDLSMPVRVLSYGIYSSLGVSISLVSIKGPESPVPDLIIATAASALLLIFGTQRDILNAVCHFWRNKGRTRRQAEHKGGSGPMPYYRSSWYAVN